MLRAGGRDMTKIIVLFFLGLLMIVLGGDAFVGYASSLAARLGVSPLIIGATVVSIGTTLPEVVVSTTAAFSGCGEIAVGNALGSIICNSCLIGGVGALCLPSSGLRRGGIVKRLFFFLLAACFTAFSVMKTGGLGVGLGIILLSLFAIYALTSAAESGNGEAPDQSERPELICFGLIIGAAALYIGSGLLVDNGILLAEALRVPQKVIAVTFIALGTSLPELVTTVASVIKKQGSIGFGNIIGANILNLLLVIGLPSALAPISAGREIYRDIAAAVFAMCALTLPAAIKGKTYRLQGAALLLMYAAYMAVSFMGQG